MRVNPVEINTMPRRSRPANSPDALAASVAELGAALGALAASVRQDEARRKRARLREKARTGMLKPLQGVQTSRIAKGATEPAPEGKPLIEGWVPLTQLAGLEPEQR